MLTATWRAVRRPPRGSQPPATRCLSAWTAAGESPLQRARLVVARRAAARQPPPPPPGPGPAPAGRPLAPPPAPVPTPPAALAACPRSGPDPDPDSDPTPALDPNPDPSPDPSPYLIPKADSHPKSTAAPGQSAPPTSRVFDLESEAAHSSMSVAETTTRPPSVHPPLQRSECHGRMADDVPSHPDTSADLNSYRTGSRMRTRVEERERVHGPRIPSEELRLELKRAMTSLSRALVGAHAARAEKAFYRLLDAQQSLFGDRWASPFILLRADQINRLLSICATPSGLAGSDEWEDRPDGSYVSVQHDSSASGSERVRDRGASQAAFRVLALLERLSKSISPSPLNPAMSRLGDDLSVMNTHAFTLQRILFSTHSAPRPPLGPVELTGSKDETVLERILHLISHRSLTISRKHLEEALFVLRIACPSPYPVLQPSRSLAQRDPNRAEELAQKVRDAAIAAGKNKLSEVNPTMAARTSDPPCSLPFSPRGGLGREWKGGQPPPGEAFPEQYEMRREHSRHMHVQRVRFQQRTRPRVFILLMEMAARATPRARHLYQYPPSHIKRRLQVLQRLLDMPLGGAPLAASASGTAPEVASHVDEKHDSLCKTRREKEWLRVQHLMAHYTSYEVKPEVAPQWTPVNSENYEERPENADEQSWVEVDPLPEYNLKLFSQDDAPGGATPLTPPGLTTAVGTLHLHTFVDELETLLADHEAASDPTVPTRPRTRRQHTNPNEAENPRQPTWTADHSLRIIECGWSELMRSLMLPSAVQGKPASVVPMRFPLSSKESIPCRDQTISPQLSKLERDALQTDQTKIMYELGSRLHRLLTVFAFKSLTLDAVPMILSHAAKHGRLNTPLLNTVISGFRISRPQMTLDPGGRGAVDQGAASGTEPVTRTSGGPSVMAFDNKERKELLRSRRRAHHGMSSAERRRSWASHLAIGLVSYEKAYQRELGDAALKAQHGQVGSKQHMEEDFLDEGTEPEKDFERTHDILMSQSDTTAGAFADSPGHILHKKDGSEPGQQWELSNGDPAAAAALSQYAAEAGGAREWQSSIQGDNEQDDSRVYRSTDDEPTKGWMNHDEVPWRSIRLSMDPMELGDERVEVDIVRAIYEAMRDGALRNELLAIDTTKLSSPYHFSFPYASSLSSNRPKGLLQSLYDGWARLLHRGSSGSKLSTTMGSHSVLTNLEQTNPWDLGGVLTPETLPAPVLEDWVAHGLSSTTASPAGHLLKKWLGVATLPPQAVPDQETYTLVIQCLAWQNDLSEAFSVLQAMVQTPISSGRVQFHPSLSREAARGSDRADPVQAHPSEAPLPDHASDSIGFLSSAINEQRKYDLEKDRRQTEAQMRQGMPPPHIPRRITVAEGVQDVDDETFVPSLAIYDGLFRAFARHGVGGHMTHFNPTNPSASEFLLPWEEDPEQGGPSNPWNIHAFVHIFEAFLRLTPRTFPRRVGWKDAYEDDLQSSLKHLGRLLETSKPLPDLPRPSQRPPDPAAPFNSASVGTGLPLTNNDNRGAASVPPVELLRPESSSNARWSSRPHTPRSFQPSSIPQEGSAGPSHTTLFWLLTALRVVSNDDAHWVLAQWDRAWNKFSPQVPWLVSARARRETRRTPGLMSHAVTKYGARRANVAGSMFLQEHPELGSLWHTVLEAQAQRPSEGPRGETAEHWVSTTISPRLSRALHHLLGRKTRPEMQTYR